MRTKRKEPEIVHRIRPHHGMCLYFFEGKGYSSTFSEHMAQVKEELLQNNGEALLELVTRTDDICSACPHNLNGNCETYGKVNAYDAGVLVVWKVVRSCHSMNWRLWWKQESCMRDTAEKSAGTVNGAASVIKDEQEE